MFLEDFILLEDDEHQSGDEPTEKDSDMSESKDDGSAGLEEMADGDSDMGGDDLGDDEGGDDEGDDDLGGEDGGGDSEDGGGDSEMSPDEAMKKRKLFGEYKNLLQLTDELLNSINFIDVATFTPNEKKIYQFLQDKMKSTKEKIRIITIEQFSKMPYKQLLTLFLYLKMSVKSYTDIINEIINN
jgi:hypothetical protein